MKYLLCGINAKYIHSNLAVYSLKKYADLRGPESARVCHLPAGFNLKKYRFCKGFPCFFLHFMV